jgi:pimeloyl-ACP methyl ester carboxylesterase
MVVMHGARDLLVPVSASRILYQSNPGSQLVILDSAGHCPQLDGAAAVAQHARQLAVNATVEQESS